MLDPHDNNPIMKAINVNTGSVVVVVTIFFAANRQLSVQAVRSGEIQIEVILLQLATECPFGSCCFLSCGAYIS